jgi:L,D-transpeptidase ErfK/SrfK
MAVAAKIVMNIAERIHRAVTWVSTSLLLAAPVVQAELFALPQSEDTVVGQLELTSTIHEDTLLDIAQVYGQGYWDMRLANPGVDTWIPGAGQEIWVPGQYILPDAQRDGIVINVPEMRLYFYPRAKAGEPRVVMTFPISIGRQDWRTPYGLTKIVTKTKNPAWYPPDSIRKEHAERGDALPAVVPAGPDNPLGDYALRLAKRGYLIHGTNKPGGLGMRVTHGCIRLYPKDIDYLFHNVSVGTPVRLVNQPVKLGLLHGQLYVEAHPPLEEHREEFADLFTQVVEQVIALTERYPQQVDWQALRKAVTNPDGVPRRIGVGLPVNDHALPLLGDMSRN